MSKTLALWLCLVFTTLADEAKAGGYFYFWDPEGTGTESAANLTGTWDNTSSLWSSSILPTASPTAWVAGSMAYFCAGSALDTNPFTVNVNTPISISGIYNGTFSPGVFLTLGGSGSLDLASGPDVFNLNNADGGTVTIAVPLTGSGQIVLEGTSTLFLNATNSYVGGTMFGISERAFTGTVRFNNDEAFGTGPIIMTFDGNGATLQVEGTSALTLSNALMAANASLNIIGNPAGLTLAGPWDLSATPMIGSIGVGNLVTISGPMSGTGGITTYGVGTLVLSGSNTYSGFTTISNGELSVTGDDNLGAVPAAPVASIILSGGTLNASNTFMLDPNRLILLTDDSSLGVSTGQTLTYGGAITGTAALSKTGAGTLALFADNSYTGTTTVSAGTLEIDSQGGTAVGTNTVIIASGATLSGLGDVGGLVTGAGNVAPGTAVGPGTLTMASGMDLSSGGTYVWNLSSNSTSTSYSIISLIGGNLTLGGNSVLSINITNAASAPDTHNPFWRTQEAWTIVSMNGSAGNPTQSKFTTLLNGTYAAGNFTNYVYADGSVVLLYQPNFAVFDALFDSGPGFFSGENLIFTNFSGLPLFVWSSTSAGLAVSNWTLVGQMAEQPLAPQLPGYSRYSMNVVPTASPAYYVAGNTNAGPYLISPVPAAILTTPDFVNFTVVDTNVAISATGVLDLLPAPAPPVILPGGAYSGGQFQFQFNAGTNQDYTVQASLDLMNWTNVGTGTTSNPPTLFIDAHASNYNSQFYRIVLPP